MSLAFDGKVVVVTGAGSGIGRCTALAFAAHGANVVLADISREGGATTLEMIKSRGGSAIFFAADVSRDAEVGALISTAVRTFGRLDLAHNNAGIEGRPGFIADCTEQNWDQVLAVNLKGVWLCMKYELQEMVKHNRGSIVNTASIAGLVGMKGFPAYVASKHGIVGLTKAAALEYGRQGVRVNAVCPGLIETPMIKRQTGGDPDAERRLIEGLPLGRIGQPEEVAQAVLWLCSDGATLVNGHALSVDDAYVAR